VGLLRAKKGGAATGPSSVDRLRLLGDMAYDSKAVRGELRRRRIQAVISRWGSPNIKGLGERRIELHDSFLSLACSLI
jgi:transposase InsO family protein